MVLDSRDAWTDCINLCSIAGRACEEVNEGGDVQPAETPQTESPRPVDGSGGPLLLANGVGSAGALGLGVAAAGLCLLVPSLLPQ